MNKKKKLILEAARLLFNKKGYQQVTIRMIALELKMSSGNLNYHYKKREDIFEALYFEMVSVFDQRIKDLTTTQVSLPQIRNDIERSMTRMIDYKFFWTDLYNLLTISNKVQEHFNEVYKNRIDGCFLLFEKMKKEDLMKDSSFELEYKFLAERMVTYGNTWLYASQLYSNIQVSKLIDTNVTNLLSVLYPYLTSKGKQEFRYLLPRYFE